MIFNVHEREWSSGRQSEGLLESLGSNEDRLWPHEAWPPMRFDRALEVGARGGHGPVRYFVEEHEPGRRIRFRFTAPSGFDGFHEYRLAADSSRVVLQHVLKMTTHGRARLTWPLFFRPLHDALIEDSLDKAGGLPPQRRWSLPVRILRGIAQSAARAGPGSARVAPNDR